jgi:DNA polymerase-3 subunit alpha
LFDEVAQEVRRFAKRPIDELLDTREPQLLAGIVAELRVINGARGRLALFKLEDNSGSIEARADDKMLTAYKHLLKDDTLVLAMGKAQPDRFSGGMQFTITQLWDLEQARCRFGKYLRVAVNGQAPDVARVLREFPALVEQTEQGEVRRGLAVRLAVVRPASHDQPEAEGAQAELVLGDDFRFYPSDAALALWRSQADAGRAVIAYD